MGRERKVAEKSWSERLDEMGKYLFDLKWSKRGFEVQVGERKFIGKLEQKVHLFHYLMFVVGNEHFAGFSR